tara:strand:+ start:2216 stop:2428 length:213 start_codon:yes stop_codon:yes gene_type:complete
MSNIWEEKMNEYYMRKKYNLKKNEKIFKYEKQYYYEGLVLQEKKYPKMIDGRLILKKKMIYIKCFYLMTL